jgi:protein-L-isoaspartate(D-aspartate) O-methyltransferase
MTFWNPPILFRNGLAILAVVGLMTASGAQQDDAAERRRMVEQIDAMVASTASSSGVARLDPRLRGAMTEVPRREFVPLEYRSAAYENEPLPVGHGQTIS